MSTTKLKKKSSIDLIKTEFLMNQAALPINDFFPLLLSALSSSLHHNSNDKKETNSNTVNDHNLIRLLYTYFFYFKGFISSIQSIHPQKYNEVLFKIAEVMKYEAYESNMLLMRYGDNGGKYYFILQGKVDIILLDQKEVSITKVDYLRYLAYLIGYKEYELLNKVINANMEHCPLCITDLLRNNKYNRINSGLSPQYLELRELFELLTKEEQLLLKHGFEDSSIQLISDRDREEKETFSTEEYLSRMKQREAPGKILPSSLFDNETLIDFTIYDHYLVTTLTEGKMFGDYGLSDFTAKRNATAITSDQCHLGILTKSNYELVFKGVNDQIRKDNMDFIFSSYIFKGISPTSSIQKKFYNFFVLNTIPKGYKVFNQNGEANDLFFLRRGIYEISAHMSYEKLLVLINHLYSVIKKPEYKFKDKECELAFRINEMNELRKRIITRAKEIKSLNDFYHLNETYLLSSLTSPDIIGFSDFYGIDDTILYTFELKSQDGEYFSLNKEIYTQMCQQEPLVHVYENKYVTVKIKTMLRRLLFLQLSKLEIYFRHNPDYFYFEEFSLKKKMNLLQDILKVKTTLKDKRPKCILNCMSSLSIRTIKREISTEHNYNKEDNKKKIETSNIVQYTTQSLLKKTTANMSPQYKSTANSILSTGNWKNGSSNYQTQTISNSNSVSLMKGNCLKMNKTETINNSKLTSSKKEKGKEIIHLFLNRNNSIRIKLKNMLETSPNKETVSPNQGDNIAVQTLPCVKLDYSLSPFPSSLKPNTVSIIDNLTFKQGRYRDKMQHETLKQTRNQVMRFRSQLSIGKKRISSKKKKAFTAQKKN